MAGDRARDVAVADLAARLGVDPREIEVVAVRPVTWPNGALGCPEPDRVYTQALVSGYLLVLRRGNRVFAFHGRRGRDPFLCASDEPDGGRAEDAPKPGRPESRCRSAPRRRLRRARSRTGD